VKARAVTGRVGGVIHLSYTGLDDGAAVRERVVVSAKKTVVFTATTTARLASGRSYSVVWHPAKRLRGRYSWCVRSISADGTQSPQSCSTVTLR